METRVVEIVYAYDPETDGPDLNEIGRQYTLPRKEAREIVNSGAARYADIPVDDAGRALADQPRTVAARRAVELGLAVDGNESKSAIIARIEAAEQQAAADKAAELPDGEAKPAGKKTKPAPTEDSGSANSEPAPDAPQ